MDLGFIRNFLAIFGLCKRASRRIIGGTIRRRYPKRGRNEPCWCRSGKKYKRCHWREDYLNGTV